MESDDISANIVVDDAQKIPASTRYYRLHRDKRLAYIKDKYHNRPDVIAKREVREKRKAEKIAEKEAEKQVENKRKNEEREKKSLEKLMVAIKTSKIKGKILGELGQFVEQSSPVCEKTT